MSDALPKMPAISEGTKAHAAWFASPHRMVETTWGTIYRRCRVVIPWLGEVYVAEVWATAEAAEEPSDHFMGKLVAAFRDPEFAAWRETWRSAQHVPQPVPQVHEQAHEARRVEQRDDAQRDED